MLNIDTNGRNKGIFNPNPDKGANFGIWDFTRSSLRITGSSIRFKEIYILKDGDEMRADLIANRKYGDQNKCGSVLKINGYSNPFAIDQGDFLYIPFESGIENAFEIRQNELANDSDNEDSEGKKFRKKQEGKKFSQSSDREKYLNAIKNRDTANLPPNVLGEGEQQVVTKSGLIFFGPDATNPNG